MLEPRGHVGMFRSVFWMVQICFRWNRHINPMLGSCINAYVHVAMLTADCRILIEDDWREGIFFKWNYLNVCLELKCSVYIKINLINKHGIVSLLYTKKQSENYRYVKLYTWLYYRHIQLPICLLSRYIFIYITILYTITITAVSNGIS